MTPSTRRAAAIALAVLSLLFVIGGVIYMTTVAADLPGFLPGKPEFRDRAVQINTKTYENQGRVVKDGKVFEADGTTPAKCKVGSKAVPAKGDKSETCTLYNDRKLAKRGVLMFIFAGGLLVGAWYMSGLRPQRTDDAAPDAQA